jgi:hypothetical protein
MWEPEISIISSAFYFALEQEIRKVQENQLNGRDTDDNNI